MSIHDNDPIDHYYYPYLDERRHLKSLGIHRNHARLIYGHSPDPFYWHKRYSVSEPIENISVPNFDSLEQLEEAAEYLHDLAMDYDGSLSEFKHTVHEYLEELEENE